MIVNTLISELKLGELSYICRWPDLSLSTKKVKQRRSSKEGQAKKVKERGSNKEGQTKVKQRRSNKEGQTKVIRVVLNMRPACVRCP